MIDLATLRLFADIRDAATKLRGLDNPNPEIRARLVRDTLVHKALIDMLHAAGKLIGPDSSDLFWHPDVEPLSDAEKRWEKIRRAP